MDDRPKLAWLLLAGILLLAGGLRFYQLGARSLWVDELGSMRFSAGKSSPPVLDEGIIASPRPPYQIEPGSSAVDVWKSQGRDIHPPLYFVILRFWREGTGDGEAAMRTLSVLCSLGSIVALFVVARGWFGTTAALWACAITAVAYEHILNGREIRQYGMLGLLGMLALFALQRLERTPDFKRATWLALAVWAMAVTHYYFIGAAAALGIYALLGLRGRERKMAVGALFAAGVLFAVTNGYWVQQQRKVAPEVFTADQGVEPNHVLQTLGRADATPATLLMRVPPPLRPVAPAAVLLVILPLFVVRKKPIWLMTLWAVCVIGVVTFNDLNRGINGLELGRYTVLAVPAIATLIAAGAGATRFTRHAVPAAIALACLWTVPNAYSKFETGYPNLHREMAQLLARDVRPGDAIVFVGQPKRAWYPRMLFSVWMYYGERSRPDVPLAYTYHPASPAMREQLKDYPRVWVAARSSLDTTGYLPGAPEARPAQRLGEFATLRLFVNPDFERK